MNSCFSLKLVYSSASPMHINKCNNHVGLVISNDVDIMA